MLPTKQSIATGLDYCLCFAYSSYSSSSVSQQDLNTILLAILLGAGVLHLLAWVSGGVYKNGRLEVLEGSFALNLTMLAAVTYYVKLSKGNQLAVG